LAPVGVFAVPAAVAGVNLALGVQEEDRERQVVVELEQVQVEVIDAGQPDADELVGDVVDALQTDNLPVKFAAVRSGLAAQDHHERLAGPARLGLPLLQAEKPAVPGGLRTAEPPPSSLSRQRGVGQDNQAEGQEGRESASHEELSDRTRYHGVPGQMPRGHPIETPPGTFGCGTDDRVTIE
jgi:hypothetical protein